MPLPPPQYYHSGAFYLNPATLNPPLCKTVFNPWYCVSGEHFAKLFLITTTSHEQILSAMDTYHYQAIYYSNACEFCWAQYVWSGRPLFCVSTAVAIPFTAKWRNATKFLTTDSIILAHVPVSPSTHRGWNATGSCVCVPPQRT